MAKQACFYLRMALLLLLLLTYSTDAKMDIITSKQDIQVGDEILLLCKAGGEGDIMWQKNGEDIDEEMVSKVDETSSKLLIRRATVADGGKYTCICDFDNGHKDEVQTQLFVYEGPSFGSTPTYHEFLEGTDGNVPCLVSGQPVVEVRWIYNKEASFSDRNNVRQLPDNALLIEKVRRQDAGTYVCHAQIKGRPIFKQLFISVVINAPPTVRLREEVKKVIAGPETNVSLLCLVDGQPKPNITWSMPVLYHPGHHKFNSDRSQLTIRSVARDDYGEYVCTATNKITETSATIMLQVFEAPEVSLSVEQQNVNVGERVSVACNVSGLPQPELHWINKYNGQTLDSSSGRVRVEEGVLVIDEIVPSDGGLYSCMAVSIIGNASRDVAIHTQPGPPLYVSVSPGPASVFFSLKTLPVSGGTPITSFVLQWRKNAAEQWKEVTVPNADTLAVTALKPYTLYSVRLAALNAAGLGHFSEANTVHTQGIRGEPDSPVLLSDEMNIGGNSFSVPLKPTDDGGSPLLHYTLRYRQDKDGAEWKEKQLSSNTDSVTLKDLAFATDYQLEVIAVNMNGSSIPAIFNFTIAEQPVRRSSMTKGSVVGIVMVIFLVVFLVVDATCCYRNHCGLLMSIAVKLFGQKVPGLKVLEEGEGTAKEDLKMNGISTPRGGRHHTGVQTNSSKEGGPLKEVACDKVSLTKHEATQPDRNMPKTDA
ncbi:neural cell adhesion molecule 1 [Dunckerocampus dactyliophorus]|uniref:neural cell adhesion molecule 1 n=1 Tax=Dunckerocampus dactyliophorus TaxID=161453 RepID=UPI002404F947|nr:neural cell adhesion molecule 1 [Dunckerocampus dactyliophorus]